MTDCPLCEQTPRVVCPCCGSAVQRLPPANVGAFVSFGYNQKIIFDFLAKRFGRWTEQRQLIDAVYGNQRSGGPTNAHHVFRVTLTNMRAKLKPYRMGIEGNQAGRYRMHWIDT